MSVLTMKSDEYKTFPLVLREYAEYTVVIKGNSEKTVCEYLLDLRTFFRFMLTKWNDLDISKDEFEKLSIKSINESDVKRVTQKNIIEYLMFAGYQRDNSRHEHSNRQRGFYSKAKASLTARKREQCEKYRRHYYRDTDCYCESVKRLLFINKHTDADCSCQHREQKISPGEFR